MGNGTTLSLRRNVLWNTVGCVFYQGCLWLMTILVVRLSDGYQNSGALAFAMSVGNVYTALGTYNMRTYQISDINNENTAANYVALRLVTTMGALVVCGTYAFLVSPSKLTLGVIWSFLLFKLDESFTNVLYGVDQKSMRMDFIGVSQIVRGIVVVGVFSAGMIVTQNVVISLLGVFFGCLSVTLAYDIPHARRLASSLVPKISLERCAHLLKVCFPSVLSLVLGTLVVSTVRQHFGIVYGEEALGIYASVATPCVIIQVLAQNVYTPLLGPIAEDYRRGNVSAGRRGAARLMLLLVCVALALSAALGLVGEPLLETFYGQSILPYVYLLFPALLVATGVAAAQLLTDLLIVFDKLPATLSVNGVALLVSLVLMGPLTERFYMSGINLTLIVAYVTSTIVGVVVLFRTPQSP